MYWLDENDWHFKAGEKITFLIGSSDFLSRTAEDSSTCTLVLDSTASNYSTIKSNFEKLNG